MKLLLLLLLPAVAVGGEYVTYCQKINDVYSQCITQGPIAPRDDSVTERFRERQEQLHESQYGTIDYDNYRDKSRDDDRYSSD